MARFVLLIKALLFRTLASLVSYIDIYFFHPRPQRVSFTRQIPSTVGAVPGSIKLLFYTPPSYNKPSPSPLPSAVAPQAKEHGQHPILINFHGGGFTIGTAEDDAWWFTAVTSQTRAVVISVEYRLAPSYPFPTGIEDCVSAVLWVWSHAAELNLDISQTTFSGFSAGGNFTYTVAIRLWQELRRLKELDQLENVEVGRLMGLVSFYPSTDWTHSRAERDASNANLIPVITPAMYRLFDESYLYPKARLDMSDPLLSPGLASEEILRQALPDNLVLIDCEGDQLLAESVRFKERLRRFGKRIDGYTVQGVGHGFDKHPSFGKENLKRDEAYRFAVNSLREFWALDH